MRAHDIIISRRFSRVETADARRRPVTRRATVRERRGRVADVTRRRARAQTEDDRRVPET